MDIQSANYDVGLGLVIGVLSSIPIAAFIYVAESARFAALRGKLKPTRSIRGAEKIDVR